MEDFKNSLEHYQLSNMGFSGPRFIWSNRRQDDTFTQERLDRAVANVGCCSIFPQLCVEVLAARSSNHAPLHHETGGQHRRSMRFRYEAWWKKQRGYKAVIKQVWQIKARRASMLSPIDARTTLTPLRS